MRAASRCGIVGAMRLMHVGVVLALLGSRAWAEAPRELIEEAKALLVVGACAEGTPPATVTAKTVEAHCKIVRKV